MLIAELKNSFMQELWSDGSESVVEHLISLSSVLIGSLFDSFISAVECRKTVSHMVIPTYMKNLGDKSGYIAVVPIGEVSRSNVSSVCNSIREVYGCEIRLMRRRAIPYQFYDATDDSMNGDALLASVTNEFRFYGAQRIVFVTDERLKFKTEHGEYAQGLAYIDYPACIVSTGRISSKRSIVVVTLHELGHTYSLTHCFMPDCLMSELPKSWQDASFCVGCERVLRERNNG